MFVYVKQIGGRMIIKCRFPDMNEKDAEALKQLSFSLNIPIASIYENIRQLWIEYNKRSNK